MCREMDDFSGAFGHNACLPHLRRLDLKYSMNLSYLTPLTQLSSLNISGGTFREGLLPALLQLTGLQGLDLSNYSPDNSVSDLVIERLATLQALTGLNIGGASMVTDGGLQALTGLCALCDLTISSTNVSDAGLEPLSCLASLTVLRAFNCSNLALQSLSPSLLRLAIFAGHRQHDTLICSAFL